MKSLKHYVRIKLIVFSRIMKRRLLAPAAVLFIMSAFMTSAIFELITPVRSYAKSNTVLSDDTSLYVNVTNYPINLDGAGSSYRDPINEFVALPFCASTPNVVTLVDNSNHINVAYSSSSGLVIQKYDSDMKLSKTITLQAVYDKFGDVICDGLGYYYVIWGQDDTTKDGTGNTICVAKYNNNGKLVNKLELAGADTDENSTYYTSEGLVRSTIAYSGTKYPFDAGNCDLAATNGILAVNYAREMYNGHQSSMIIYLNTTTLARKFRGTGETAYTSHSFDQRAYALSDGGFIFLNHGDANSRAFRITKYNYNGKSLTLNGDVDSFHFREGANRSYGYNYTYAQMGGLAETSNAYVFCGSSERLLSAEPVNNYMRHNDARDLFIQILKKNYGDYTGGSRYAVTGTIRTVQGNKPASSSTELFLNGDERDYGVIWLTAYDSDHYAANPKVVSIGNGKVVVLWEKKEYYGSKKVETYCAVIDENGNIVTNTMVVEDSLPAADTDPVVIDGKVYWATNDEYGAFIHCLDPNSYTEVTKPTKLSLSETELSLNKNDTYTLTASCEPSDAKTGKIIWESDKSWVVSVDSDGKITGLREGTATITATTKIGKVKASCEVTVLAEKDSQENKNKNKDKESPVVSSVKLTSLRDDYFTISAEATDNVGVSEVRYIIYDGYPFPDRSNNLYEGTMEDAGNNTYTAQIPLKKDKLYYVHVYAYDTARNYSENKWTSEPTMISFHKYRFSNIHFLDDWSKVGNTLTFSLGSNGNPDDRFTYLSSDSEILSIEEPEDDHSVSVKTNLLSEGTATITAVIRYAEYPDADCRVTTTITVTEKDQGSSGNKYISENDGKDVPDGYMMLFRFYNPNSGEHFYTGSRKEGNNLIDAGWTWEGNGWIAPKEGNPVFRLYNPNAGDHHYTQSEKERDNLIEAGWSYEGIAWNTEPAESGKPLYRLYNPNAVSGAHHYTQSEKERNSLMEIGWQYEGIGWYGL